MSISEFSPVLREAIISRLRKRLKAASIDDIKSFEIDNIRAATNKKAAGYEAVITRGNLSTLSRQFLEEKSFKGNAAYSKVYSKAESPEDLEQLAVSAAKILSDESLFDNFLGYLANKKPLKYKKGSGELEYATVTEDIKVGRISSTSISPRDVIILKENHGDLAKVFKEFLLSNSSGIQAADPRVVDFIKDQLDAGHLVGVFNLRFKRIFNLRSSPVNGTDVDMFSISNTKTNNEQLTQFLNSVNSLFIQADYISSNTLLDPDVFLTAEKRVYRKNPSISVELQLSAKNQAAGRKLTSISRSLNSLIISIRGMDKETRPKIDAIGAKSALESFLKGVSKLSSELKEEALRLQNGVDLSNNKRVAAEISKILTNTATIDKLIGARGSDSLKESIETTIKLAILGQKPKAAQVTRVTIADPGKVLKVPSVPTKASSKVASKKPTAKSSVRKVKQVGSTAKSLSSLQNLLNSSLREEIVRNMGTGNSKRVLNYRTGRFADSVKVERLSANRQGAITAFYSYMKNPYATFSEGGRQQYPKTRDPKLLISKSIRDLAAKNAYNILRSVNV